VPILPSSAIQAKVWPDRAGADVGARVQRFRAFSRVPVSVFCFPFVFVSIFSPTSCEEGERSSRAEIRDARVRR